VQTFDYEPARDGLALLKGGPTDAGYAAYHAAHPSLLWQPRYIPQGVDPKGGTDVYSGQYQWNIDPEFAWSNGYTPFSIDKAGNLHIRAQSTDSVSPSFQPGEIETNPVTGAPFSIVSGMLTSKNSFSQQGGYFEFTAQVPTGYGLWPAMWLMPFVEAHPPEVDIMEYVGGYDPSNVYRATAWSLTGQTQTLYATPKNIALGFHTYAAMWTDTTLTFYFDGNVVATEDITEHPELGEAFYFLMCVQVGSSLPEWVPPPNATTPAQADLVVRSVKAWQFPGPIGVHLSASAYLDSIPVGGTVGALSTPCFEQCGTLTYTKVSDPDGMFTISGSNLTLAQAVPASVKASHQVTVRVTDSFGRVRTRLFTLGVITGAPVQANYVTTQALNTGYWSGNNAALPAANTMMESAAVSDHTAYIASPIPRGAGAATYGAWVEATPALGRTEVYFQVFDATYASQAFGYFNLATGVVDYVATTGAFRGATALIAPLPGGAYRCAIQFTTDASSSGFQFITGVALSASVNSYAGNPLDGMVVQNPWIYNVNAGAGGY
jgi:hypothetical protein